MSQNGLKQPLKCEKTPSLHYSQSPGFLKSRIGNGALVIILIQMTILSFINFMPLSLTIGKSTF